MIKLSPKKLLLTKWTAAHPLGKEKHFLVAKVIQPEPPEAPVEWVELEAVFSKSRSLIAWRDLKNPAVWLQGWV
jgi:tryptophan-rich hypothetical protein